MYGSHPLSDESEVTLFGPGYGEAVAVHLGERCWVLVDSCLHPENKQPASLHYLNEIGARPADVKVIVASHWHDDHVRGLGSLVAAFPAAHFFLSSVFNDREALAFLAAHGGETAAPQAKGMTELYQVVSTHEDITFADQRTIILEKTIGGRDIRILAFSPTTSAQKQALLHMAAYIPSAIGTPINHAPELQPNLEAVVIHIDFGDDAVLLGSDLEVHGELGWPEILSCPVCSTKRRASAYKVAHHGSKTADTPDIWTKLLASSPVASLTPFNLGSVRLPTASDKQRIRKVAGAAYLSSIASKKPRLPAFQLKRMSDICRNLSQVNSGFGAIRLRKKLGRTKWRVELLGRAAEL